MSYDPESFRAVYLPSPLPIALGGGWNLDELRADRLRAAIGLCARDPSGRTLRLFVERRVEGAACFASTRALQVSYYSEPGVDDSEAGRVARAIATLLSAAEGQRSQVELDRALSVGTEGSRPRILELRINRECNEACVFCNTPERSETILPPDAILTAIAREHAAGYRELTLTGREPTLDPALESYVSAARDAGYRTIRVQTNGTALAHGPLLDRLIGAGMNAIEVSLHTLDPGTFKHLVGPAHLLDKTIAALERLATHPEVRASLVVVLTTMNLDHLPAVLERAFAAHPRLDPITVSPMAPVGDGEGRPELMPRLPDLQRTLDAALLVAKRNGMRLVVPSRCGAPPCAMPRGSEAMSADLANPPGGTLEAGKSKPLACSRCRHDPVCSGLWNGYRARYGDGDVQPLV